MDEITKKQISNFTMELYSCNSYSKLLNLIDQYENMDNPYLYQSSGQWCLVKNYSNEAIPLFSKAIQYGINFPNKFWGTQMADSIGSAISKILTSYSTDYTKKPIINLFIQGYCYLSNCIDILNLNAFESLENRADLLIYSSNEITCEIVPMGVLPQVYTITDLYKSAQGLNKNGYSVEAREKLNAATNLHGWLEDISVAGRDADEYSLEEIVKIGEKRHSNLFESFRRKLLNNEFKLTTNDLNQITNSLSIK
jgi:hypothetical protein|tara:strand:+ start:2152 stop:2910 length:759 start_codon:yes stop_codon:yes gene_type:complete